MVREILPARRLICLTTLLTATQPTGLSCQMSLRASKCHRNEKTPTHEKMHQNNRKKQKRKWSLHEERRKGSRGIVLATRRGVGVLCMIGERVFGCLGEGEMGSARCQGARQGCDCTEY